MREEPAEQSEHSAESSGSFGAHFQLYQTSPSAPLRWRLLGGNHRPIGRSSQVFPDQASCRRDLTQLLQVLPELTGAVTRAPGNQWLWQLSHAGAEVAVASHTYDRQIRAADARRQFVERAAVARIDVAVMMSATRRWRSAPDRLIHPAPARE